LSTLHPRSHTERLYDIDSSAVSDVCKKHAWLINEDFTSHLTQNRSFPRRSSQPISWLSTEKLNQTQQKQTHNKIYYYINWIQQKAKARFGCLLRPLV